MIRLSVALIALLAVAGCGQHGDLHPRTGQSLPVKPLYAPKQPTANQLLVPDTQARPQRAEDQLDRSQDRRSDPFDLPPVN